MMVRPTVTELLKFTKNRFQLAVATAKRASRAVTKSRGLGK